MSGINGDKSRFHRLRKQKIQRRMRNRVMYAQLNMWAVGRKLLARRRPRPARETTRPMGRAPVNGLRSGPQEENPAHRQLCNQA